MEKKPAYFSFDQSNPGISEIIEKNFPFCDRDELIR